MLLGLHQRKELWNQREREEKLYFKDHQDIKLFPVSNTPTLLLNNDMFKLKSTEN